MTAVEPMKLDTAGQDDIFGLAKGYYSTRAMLAAWRLGLLERAAAGETLDGTALGAQWGVPAGQVRPLLDYLVIRGFFEKESADGYRLTARGQAARPFFGYLSTMVGAYEPVFARIEELITGSIVYGKDISRSHEEMVRGLTALEDRMMGTVTEAVRDAGGRVVLDLGCGSARMLAHICALDPAIRAVGVDRDKDSCAVARETARREGLEDRLTILQGDAGDVAALPADVVGDVDTVTVMFLLHEILRQRGRDGTVQLLRDIAELVGDGGRLVMVEVSGTTEPAYLENLLFVPEYELLHEYTNQRLAARPEWEAMVAEAGMQVRDVRPVNMCQAFCLVAGRGAGDGR
ncbi:MAG TPA: methyltransferase domain-containing protein [Mycobacteriales bacterium]|nr:methyltransferase domain-containing protein [Mycobacteriales bacterium]